MRRYALLAATLLTGFAQLPVALAQSSAPPPGTAMPAAPAPGAAPTMPPAGAAPMAHPSHMTMMQRFQQANTTGDGHLTLEQAKAGMPGLAHHFSEIDTANKGYVTFDEVRAYMRAHHPQHHAAPAPATGTPAAPAPATPQ